ncbi:hypothetical protein [Syntrophomonas palmitatica]|uniref:hypothetical protein n=1 Tax=Syntrophomonas palmitatica TaxID=402877 RepID=UPI0006D083D7|nr:hypothetical protein [Syntrophomonas palmitatica]
MSGGKWKTALVVSLVILFGSCSAIVLYFYQVFYLTERFLPGVEIASIPVSGLSRQEALNVLDNAAAGAAQCRAIFFMIITYTK